MRSQRHNGGAHRLDAVEVTHPFRPVYWDNHVLVVDKPAGLVTHPVYKHPDGTLTDCVWAWCREHALGKPWLLHQLDRDTSGLVLFARTEDAMRLCARQFAQHTVAKQYVALVWSANLPDDGVIDAPLKRDPAERRRVIVAPDGQAAVTQFTVVARYSDCALVRLAPRTGRTHQLRAHLAYLGHPILGDPVYAADYPAVPRLLLHATALGLLLPAARGLRQRTFLAPWPEEFAPIAPGSIQYGK